MGCRVPWKFLEHLYRNSRKARWQTQEGKDLLEIRKAVIKGLWVKFVSCWQFDEVSYDSDYIHVLIGLIHLRYSVRPFATQKGRWDGPEQPKQMIRAFVLTSFFALSHQFRLSCLFLSSSWRCWSLFTTSPRDTIEDPKSSNSSAPHTPDRKPPNVSVITK